MSIISTPYRQIKTVLCGTRKGLTVALFVLGVDGKICKHCGFHEASHYEHSLEWHVDNTPCKIFEEYKKETT